tara:strand:- start:4347 stop:4694 length:348 start_codon:yes stop_codon:yes gene_type:complete
MPTKKESMEFVKKFKGALKDAGLKSPSTMSSSALEKAIDSAVEKLPKNIQNEWKKVRLTKDMMSPVETEAVKKSMKKEQLKKGTMGEKAVVVRNTMKKGSRQKQGIADVGKKSVN